MGKQNLAIREDIQRLENFAAVGYVPFVPVCSGYHYYEVEGELAAPFRTALLELHGKDGLVEGFDNETLLMPGEVWRASFLDQDLEGERAHMKQQFYYTGEAIRYLLEKRHGVPFEEIDMRKNYHDRDLGSSSVGACLVAWKFILADAPFAEGAAQ